MKAEAHVTGPHHGEALGRDAAIDSPAAAYHSGH
jgi:hypothetical protein